MENCAKEMSDDRPENGRKSSVKKIRGQKCSIYKPFPTDSLSLPGGHRYLDK